MLAHVVAACGARGAARQFFVSRQAAPCAGPPARWSASATAAARAREAEGGLPRTLHPDDLVDGDVTKRTGFRIVLGFGVVVAPPAPLVQADLVAAFAAFGAFVLPDTSGRGGRQRATRRGGMRRAEGREGVGGGACAGRATPRERERGREEGGGQGSAPRGPADTNEARDKRRRTERPPPQPPPQPRRTRQPRKHTHAHD